MKTNAITLKPAYLATAIGATDTVIYLDKLEDVAGEKVTDMTPIGDIGYITLSPGTSREEFISFTGIEITTDGLTKLTGVTRGLAPVPPFNADSKYAFAHPIKSKAIFSNSPAYEKTKVSAGGNNTFTGQNTFTEFPTKTGNKTPTSPGQFATKEYVDQVASGTTSIGYDILQIEGVVGEDVSKGDFVYLDEAQGKWFKTDASVESKSKNVRIGVVQQNATVNNSTTILVSGTDRTRTSLTPSKEYYLSNTAGQISDTPGTHKVSVGYAKSSNELYITHDNDKSRLETTEKDALQTSYPLSSSNKVIASSDTTNGFSITSNTISFEASTKKIKDSNNGFKFFNGQEITVSGSNSNDGTYHIVSASAGELVVDGTLVDESAGANVSVASEKANKVVRYDDAGFLDKEAILHNSKIIHIERKYLNAYSYNDISEHIYTSFTLPAKSLFDIDTNTSGYLEIDIFGNWIKPDCGSVSLSIKIDNVSVAGITYGFREVYSPSYRFRIFGISNTQTLSNNYLIANSAGYNGEIYGETTGGISTVSALNQDLNVDVVYKFNNTGCNKYFRLDGIVVRLFKNLK